MPLWAYVVVMVIALVGGMVHRAHDDRQRAAENNKPDGRKR